MPKFSPGDKVIHKVSGGVRTVLERDPVKKQYRTEEVSWSLLTTFPDYYFESAYTLLIPANTENE